jgi:serine/threonine protein phosphatase 1
MNEGRTIAIGDVHGCPAALAALVRAITPTPLDTLVFLGDYIDRGGRGLVVGFFRGFCRIFARSGVFRQG